MIAHPAVTALFRVVAGEDIEAGFEPVVDALRDLDSLVQRVGVMVSAPYTWIS
jgi:hypothetical protein